MVEAAHQFIVELSSVAAFAVAVVAVAIILTSLRKFSKGVVRDTVVYYFIQLMIIAVSMGSMAYYHVFNVDVALDIWHIGIMIALVFSIFVTYQAIRVTKMFSKL